MPSTKKTSFKQLRLRVFAGPNGSGKSTVIDYVREYKVNGKAIDFGHYINADDIASSLRREGFSFNPFRITATNPEFCKTVRASGLINETFPESAFLASYILRKNTIKLKDKAAAERLAQIIADFLRKKLLAGKKRFSFETVFSHASKLEIMREAVAAGYKVYLYFVSTESPEINKFRVAARKAKGGHDVPEDKIEGRYFRSLELLYDACQLSYQVYFFDNSREGSMFKLFAHFKKSGRSKRWDPINRVDVPQWFIKYYSMKVTKRIPAAPSPPPRKWHR